ncbi:MULTISPECIES: sensor domain-containing diguanylate cyclase [Pseudomonas]|uniref:sensor domain-containing diguanylate cyclase n=1 Tax=Pseudomonas TaxID=286 RepID=UPI00257DD0F7|nr:MULTISPECIES: diguanylate cyclase [Pseudomonas]
MKRPNAFKKNRGYIDPATAGWMTIGASLILGALITVAVSIVTRHFYEKQLQERFELAAVERASLARERLIDQTKRLDALRRFFVFSEDVDRRSFEGYSEPLLNDTFALTWYPRIEASARDAFEAAVRQDGVADFRIRELADPEGDDLALRPAGERAEYFPLLYSVSHQAPRRPLGFDLLSYGSLQPLLDRARTENRTIISESIALFGSRRPQDRGLLIFAPVYNATPISPSGALQGYVGALVSLQSLMESGISDKSRHNLMVELLDVTGDSPQSLYRSEDLAARSDMRYALQFPLDNRLFELRIQPTDLFMQANQSPLVIWVVLFGIVLTLLISAFLYSLVNQRQRALALVTERTADLRAREQELAASERRWSFALDGSGDGVWDWDMRTDTMFFSGAWKSGLGYAEEDIGNSLDEWSKRVHPDDLPRALNTLQRHFDGELPSYLCEYRMQRRDGTWAWILDRGKVVERDAEGKATRAIGTHSDVSWRKAAELELARAHGQLSGLLDAATQVSIVATDMQGQVMTFNVGAQRMLGYSAQEAVGQLSVLQLHDPAELQRRAEELGQQLGRPVEPLEAIAFEVLRENRHDEREWTFVRRDGSRLTVNLFLTGIRDEADRLVGILGIATDITERRRVRAALEARDQLLEKLSSRVPGVIYQYQLNPDGTANYPYVSAGIREVYEIEPEALRRDASLIHERVHPDDRARVDESIQRSAERLSFWTEDYRALLPGKGLRWFRAEALPERLADGAVLWHGYLSDITGLKLVEQELRELSITDSLTGVYNRRYFQQQLEIQIVRLQRHPGALSVVMLDIDRFKQINDQFGHGTGDLVLKRISQRICHRVRRSDVFCRLGGEEFAVLCPDTDLQQADILARALLEELRRDPVEGVGVVTASFGVALWQPGEDADALLRRADAGVYAAKQAGRDRVVVNYG